MKSIQLLILILMVSIVPSFMSFDTDINQNTTVKDKKGETLQAKYVRKNAHKDTKNMQILADALKKMKEMDCTNPISWYMQGAVHGAPTHDYEKQTYEVNNQFCKDFTKAKTEIWHNCTHKGIPETPIYEASRWHFYTWHKLYLTHFEEIIRYVSGEPSFTLPYWEYDNPKYQTMPPLFMDKKSSLYTSARSRHVNKGGGVQKSFTYYYVDRDTVTKPFQVRSGTSKNFVNPENAFENNTFFSFTKDLENVPHNQMHNYLGFEPESTNDPIGGDDSGGWGYMAQMYSSMDPIFWVHHANIDRLYEKWLISSMGNDAIAQDGRPTLEDYNNNTWEYRFYDVNELLKKYNNDASKFKPEDFTYYNKTIGMKGIFNMVYGVQNYAYDMFINDGSYNADYEKAINEAIEDGKWDKPEEKAQDHIIASSSSDRAIQANSRFILNLKPKSSTAFLKLKKKKIKRENWVIEIDIEFDEVPKGSFAVFVKDMKNKENHSNETLAGVMTFFGVGHNHGSSNAVHLHGNQMMPKEDMNHDHSSHEHKKHEMTFRFDIDDEVDFNNFSGMLDVKIDGMKGDNLVIDEIKLIKEVSIKQ